MRSRLSVLVAALTVAAGVLLSATSVFAQCLPATGANSARGNGGVFGGHAGYNWQQSTWVYGLETDLAGTGLKSSMTGGLTGTGCTGDAASTNAQVDWYGTLRGRLGFTANNFLIYGTGGLAYGGVKLNSTHTASNTTTSASVSQTKGGFVVGAGIDYILLPNFVLNLGYQYVDLGSLSLASSATSGGITSVQTANANARFHVLMAGLSWRFAPSAGSWGGFYAGAQGGGAWGLNTDATYR